MIVETMWSRRPRRKALSMPSGAPTPKPMIMLRFRADGDARPVDDAREDVAAEVSVPKRWCRRDPRRSSCSSGTGIHEGSTLAKMAPTRLSPIQPTQIQKRTPSGSFVRSVPGRVLGEHDLLEHSGGITHDLSSDRPG